MRGISQSRMNHLQNRVGGHTNHKKNTATARAMSSVPDKDYLIRLAKKTQPVTVAPLKRINDHMKKVEELEKQQQQTPKD